MSTSENAPISPVITLLAERDLPEAERIVRVAFGTFLGAPIRNPSGRIAIMFTVAGVRRMSPPSAPPMMALLSAPTLQRNGAP